MAKRKNRDPQGEDRLEEICRTLGELRLPGMAEELPELLGEAAREGWGEIELLWELFQREGVRKRQRRFERNLKASGLSECYGLEHFDFDLARQHGLEQGLVRDLALCEFIARRRNLILVGGVGAGKTHLGRTLGVEALKRGYKVFYFVTAELLNLLYAKRNSFHFGKLYASLRDVPLLLMDDLAYLPYAPEKVEFLFSLIVDRYEIQPGSTIVTSNTDVEEWWKFFPSKAMGMAFSDRLLDGAQGIRLTGPSIRQERTRRQKRKKDTRDPNSKGGDRPKGKK